MVSVENHRPSWFVELRFERDDKFNERSTDQFSIGLIKKSILKLWL